MLSQRSLRLKDPENKPPCPWHAYKKNPYDAQSNPDGVIWYLTFTNRRNLFSLAYAENNTLWNFLFLQPKLRTFRPVNHESTQYAISYGSTQLRDAVAGFLSRFVAPKHVAQEKLNPDVCQKKYLVTHFLECRDYQRCIDCCGAFAPRDL